MFTWKNHLAVGLAFLIFFLIYYFPAQLAWPLLQKAGVDLVELHGLSGSWHRGSAVSGRIMETPLRELAWRLRPLPWAPARGGIELRFGGEGRLTAKFRTGYRGPQVGRAVLRDLRAEVPLAVLGDRLRRFGLAVDGHLVAEVDRLELKDGRPARAEGEVRLLNFQALQPVSLVLGDFSGVIETAGEEIMVNLRDQGGPLAVDGQLRLGAVDYELNAALTPRDPGNRDLAQVLAFLGSPGPDGAIPLKFSGRW